MQCYFLVRQVLELFTSPSAIIGPELLFAFSLRPIYSGDVLNLESGELAFQWMMMMSM